MIEKCYEIDQKAQQKPTKPVKEHVVAVKAQVQVQKKEPPPPKAKKWREKDKKQLFERVKEKYLQFKKMRINIIRIDPFKKQKKKVSSRKRSKKR